MPRVIVDEVQVPASLDDPAAADFIATVDVRNAVEADGYGTDELTYPPAEILPGWLNTRYHPRRLLAARVDGRIVARGVLESTSEDVTTAWLSVQVLPEFRRRGIGTAVADALESIAVDDGRSKLIVYAVSKPGAGEQLPAPTGFGSLPLDNADVRFLLGRGYSLEQIARGSRLALPPAPGVLEEQLRTARAAAGPDYRVHTWTGPTPERWREDIAVLLTRMSTDAPTAGLEEPEDPWTVERLVEEEKLEEVSPRTPYTAAAEHIPSGRLVGFTVLDAPPEPERPVGQEDTLVLREHRGHRLGMLLKAENLRYLLQERPGHPSVITFNAEENRPMLDVNEAMGFVPMAYEGCWKKELSAGG